MGTKNGTNRAKVEQKWNKKSYSSNKNSLNIQNYKGFGEGSPCGTGLLLLISLVKNSSSFVLKSWGALLAYVEGSPVYLSQMKKKFYSVVFTSWNIVSFSYPFSSVAPIELLYDIVKSIAARILIRIPFYFFSKDYQVYVFQSNGRRNFFWFGYRFLYILVLLYNQ